MKYHILQWRLWLAALKGQLEHSPGLPRAAGLPWGAAASLLRRRVRPLPRVAAGAATLGYVSAALSGQPNHLNAQMTAAGKTWPFVLFFILCSISPAAEITSNGRGGGAWSEPTTWLGKKVPGAEDDAVIQKGDAVDFDRDDDGKTTCRKLFIDPRGVFRLKTGIGKVTFCLAGPLEARGLVQLDGSRSAGDSLELRFAAAEEPQRLLSLHKGAGLVVRGRAGLPQGRCNVAITSPKVGRQKQLNEARIKTAEGGAAIDLLRASLVNVLVQASQIDNTGSRTNERLNIVENRFTGNARLTLFQCDTPVVRKNSFQGPGAVNGKWQVNGEAIFVWDCSLADVRGNTVRGFPDGIHSRSLDCTLADNLIENCGTAVDLIHDRNASVYRNTIRGCERGLNLHRAQMATLEENRIDGAKLAIRSLGSTAQIGSLELVKPAKDSVALLYDAENESCDGSLLLINANIRPEQVKLARQPTLAPGAPSPVTAMNYLIVAVKDAPPNAAVDVRTVKPVPPLAPGAADLNVRNSPALLSKGLTPVPRPAGTPQTALPLLVKSWVIDRAGKTVPAPEYEVRVREAEGGKLLKSVKARPHADWFRGKALGAKPTLEVSLK